MLVAYNLRNTTITSAFAIGMNLIIVMMASLKIPYVTSTGLSSFVCEAGALSGPSPPFLLLVGIGTVTVVVEEEAVAVTVRGWSPPAFVSLRRRVSLRFA
jgi:hypothetical protein